MRVLITGSRAPVALDLARQLSATGHQVWMADSLRWPIGRFTRSIQKHFYLPRPVESLSEFRSAIERIAQECSIDRVIPTCEEIFYYDDRWSESGLAFRSDLNLLNRIHNKFEFAGIVAGLNFPGISSPRTEFIESSEQLQAFANESHDWVFKPVYSRFASHTLIGPTKDRLLSNVKLDSKAPWVAQRKILGKEYSTYCVAHHGKLTAMTCYHSLYKAGKGSGIYFLPHRDQRIEQFMSCLVKSLNYTGQLGLDLIEDHDGAIWILEGNPRATSGVHLFRNRDRLSNAILNCETNGNVSQSNEACDFLKPSISQAVALGFAMPFWGVTSAYLQRRLLRLPLDWWRSRDPVVRLSDPGPAFGIMAALVELLGISLREGRTLAAASTFDIEWNGQSLESVESCESLYKPRLDPINAEIEESVESRRALVQVERPE